ncbi:hypothetical protein [Prescottella agglutinans]|uniref:Uncharacterized protein n=1 Tax=Prescottella agglutinans TaxID=1644129 RepID=A0ABT6MHZ8_9NOCA|nr:hypothetical protein [Prescottella agglutinans]MDH6283946.1 hypothetical protein [Prescottella agglutinans]
MEVVEEAPGIVFPLSVTTFQYFGAASTAPLSTLIETGTSRPLKKKLSFFVGCSPTVIVAFHPSPDTCCATPTSGSDAELSAFVVVELVVVVVDDSADVVVVAAALCDVVAAASSAESLPQPVSAKLTAAHNAIPPATPREIPIYLFLPVCELREPSGNAGGRLNGRDRIDGLHHPWVLAKPRRWSGPNIDCNSGNSCHRRFPA